MSLASFNRMRRKREEAEKVKALEVTEEVVKTPTEVIEEDKSTVTEDTEETTTRRRTTRRRN
jgi:hypothetical protein